MYKPNDASSFLYQFLDKLTMIWPSLIKGSTTSITDEICFQRIPQTLFGTCLVRDFICHHCHKVDEISRTTTIFPLHEICSFFPVKGKQNLYQSLSSVLNSHPMIDKTCPHCQYTGEMEYQSNLDSLSDLIILNLNIAEFHRTSSTWIKHNTRFVFPHFINLKPYTRDRTKSEQEVPASQYEYQLVGVVIHKGAVGKDPRYHTLIKDRDYKPQPQQKQKHQQHRWLRFFRETVTEYNLSNLDEECYGGKPLDPDGGSSNARMLLYERVLPSNTTGSTSTTSIISRDEKEEEAAYTITMPDDDDDGKQHNARVKWNEIIGRLKSSDV